jgi:hypothetical protein
MFLQKTISSISYPSPTLSPTEEFYRFGDLGIDPAEEICS